MYQSALQGAVPDRAVWQSALTWRASVLPDLDFQSLCQMGAIQELGSSPGWGEESPKNGGTRRLSLALVMKEWVFVMASEIIRRLRALVFVCAWQALVTLESDKPHFSHS